MQTFSLTEHEKFKKYFYIKNDLSEIDKAFLEKTKKYIRYIKWVPGLKMIAV